MDIVFTVLLLLSAASAARLSNREKAKGRRVTEWAFLLITYLSLFYAARNLFPWFLTSRGDSRDLPVEVVCIVIAVVLTLVTRSREVSKV